MEKTAAASPRQSPPPSPWTLAHRRDGPSETPTCLIPRFSSPTYDTQRRQNASHFPLFTSVAVIIISVRIIFCFNAFLLIHVHRRLFFFFSLPNNKPASIDDQARLLYFHLSSQLLFHLFWKCTAAIHYCGDLPDFISCMFPLYLPDDSLKPATEPCKAYGNTVGVTFSIYRG